jgi:hypothetical protein
MLGGCAGQEPTAPGTIGTEPPAHTPLGVMEITISGIGSATPQASALPVSPGSPLATAEANYGLTPVEEGGRTGIQLEPLSNGSFASAATAACATSWPPTA